MSRTIKFIKKDGEIQHKEHLLNNLENSLKTIPNGEYTINISKVVKQRTYPQNKLFWLWATCIEKETGTERIDVHDYYCELFLRRHATVNGKNVIITGGTSKLNTGQFADFLDKVQADAASEFGIRLPNRDDYRWKEFEEYYKHFL